MSKVQSPRGHFNDGVERMEKAVVKALANTSFRTMPWQEVRGLVKEIARNTKLPEEPQVPFKPITMTCKSGHSVVRHGNCTACDSAKGSES